mmetsp:Transcript_16950/g.43366  ORF Transcript_16950/g.43366 Transcript_16950/m.43366 type:complete len:230 (-) Transcript_16950:298-987(-)
MRTPGRPACGQSPSGRRAALCTRVSAPRARCYALSVGRTIFQATLASRLASRLFALLGSRGRPRCAVMEGAPTRSSSPSDCAGSRASTRSSAPSSSCEATNNTPGSLERGQTLPLVASGSCPPARHRSRGCCSARRTCSSSDRGRLPKPSFAVRWLIRKPGARRNCPTSRTRESVLGAAVCSPRRATNALRALTTVCSPPVESSSTCGPGRTGSSRRPAAAGLSSAQDP